MSAFICNQKHINALVRFFATSRDDLYIYNNGVKDPIKFTNSPTDLTKLGQILIDENYKSVNSRYNENDKPERFVYNWNTKYYEPPQILKALACLRYQSCETNEYEDSIAYKIVEALESRAINKLPGYDEAEWEIN